MTSKQIVLNAYLDSGAPGKDDFSIVDAPALAPLNDGEVHVALRYLSADPYMRGRMKSTGPGYTQSFSIGQPISGYVVAEVVESKNSDAKAGDFLSAMLPYVTHQIITAEALKQAYKLNDLIGRDKASYGLGVLGMPGLTAYFGLLEILKPVAGQTLYVNGAAGAVGHLVGQMAKLKGVTVIGSAGGPQKVEYCKSLGFDHCIDYKTVTTAEELRTKIAEAAPGGIDMYFENVGGIQFDAVLPLLKYGGRAAICGSIDSYNDKTLKMNAVPLGLLIARCIRLEGFLVGKWRAQPALRDAALAEVSGWLKEGKLKVEETIVDGVEGFSTAMAGLFTGANTGKMVVRVL